MEQRRPKKTKCHRCGFMERTKYSDYCLECARKVIYERGLMTECNAIIWETLDAKEKGKV